MSNYLSDIFSQSSERIRLTVALTAGIGLISAAGFIYWYRKRQEDIPPKQWRRVGELSDLICYPIKSCAPVRLNSIACTKLGLEDGYLRDRVFMVVTTKGEFITGRQYPKMVLIQAKVDGNKLKLSTPGMMDVELDIKRLYKLTPIKCSVWGQVVDTVDCGEDVARWLSRFILSEDYGLRLVFYPGNLPTREVRDKNKLFAKMSRKDTGALHDATSFMLFNESSVSDLNTKLSDPVGVLNFRPNFVVKGALPYEEDYWKWVKIGEDVIFRNIKPCTRCIFTNINSETGQRSPDGNPLKTLKEYRQFPEYGKNPVLGIHLGVRSPGKVSIGDSVYVNVD